MTHRSLPVRPRCRTAARRTLLVAGAIAAGASLAPSALAAEFFVDPAAGADTNDGSSAQPWKTMEAVVQGGHVGTDVKAGDTVWLRSGYHGALSINGGTYATPITVAAASGQTPQVSRVSLRNTHGWVVEGLTVSPSFAASPQVGDMALVDPSSSDVVIRHCTLFSVPDATSFTADDWVTKASSGIFVRGDRVTVDHNTLRNVRFGISVDGPNALVEYNTINGFSADGLRGLGDGGTFQYNVVKNVYVGDADDRNHDDGFQSWSVGTGGVGTGEVKNVTLRGNLIINREDPNQPLSNSLQGIGCFDGFFTGWVVENNVVITDHWHGISFYGMKDSRVVNNTVIDVNDSQPGPPWIMVTAHKDKRPSENVLVRNNLATDYDVSGTNVVDDHNTTLTALGAYFVDPAKFDLHLKPDAPAVNAGSGDQAPALDADGIARPQGSAVDLGAYEWHEPGVEPTDGGVGNAGAGTGGGASGTGGASASGGANGGGASSAGGSANTAGNASSAGGRPASGAGGKPGSAGNPSAGGAGNVSPDGGTVGDASDGAASSGDSGGCSCRVGEAHGSSRRGAFVVLALVAALRRRARRSGVAPSS